MTIFITSSLLKNSQTPSDASIKNLSSSLIYAVKISGSDITPTYYATKSPKLLDIASPGMFSYFSQTLLGPIGFPSKSRNGSTLPPELSILLSSFSQSGF